jgi:hypothetical protein
MADNNSGTEFIPDATARRSRSRSRRLTVSLMIVCGFLAAGISICLVIVFIYIERGQTRDANIQLELCQHETLDYRVLYQLAKHDNIRVRLPPTINCVIIDPDKDGQ